MQEKPKPHANIKPTESRRRAEGGEEGVVGAGEGAAAEGECSDGAGGVWVGDADEFQMRIAGDGHGWDERDAHAGADES